MIHQISLLKMLFILCVCVQTLTHIHVPYVYTCPQRAEDDIRFPEIGAIDGYEPSNMVLGNKLGSFARAAGTHMQNFLSCETTPK